MVSDYLVINTGGTFGMLEGPSGLAPAANLKARIEALMPNLSGSFDLIDLEPLIDSSNLMPALWQIVAQAVLDNRAYRGIIVIHGTDTLAYTSSALSFICGGIALPIVVTGSQKPLEQAGTDAIANLQASLALLETAPGAGVYVCFGGYILQGNRARKVSVHSYQGFDSPNAPRLGLSEPVLRLVDSPSVSEHLQGRSRPDEQVPVFMNQAVTMLLIYPGFPATLIDAALQSGAQAIVLLTYGSGNLPSEDRALMLALERAVEAGVILVNLTQCATGHVEQGVYEAGSPLQRLGALEGFDLTPEAAFARMHYLLATCADKKAVLAAWPQPLCGEFTLR